MKKACEVAATLLLLPFYFESSVAAVFPPLGWVLLALFWNILIVVLRERAAAVPLLLWAGWILIGIALLGTSHAIVLVAYASLSAAVVLFRPFRFSVVKRTSLAPFILLIGASLPLAAACSFLYSIHTGELGPIQAQPGVEVVFGQKGVGPPVFSDFPTLQPKQLLASCDGRRFTVSSGPWGPGAFVFEGGGTRMALLTGLSRSSETLAQDCGRGLLYAGDEHAGGIVVFSEKDGSRVRVIEIGGGDVRHLALSRAADYLCATTSSLDSIVLDPFSGREVFRKTSKVDPRCVPYREGFILADDDTITLVPVLPSVGIAAAERAIQVIPEDHNYTMSDLAVDERRQRIYRVPYGDQYLYGLDLVTGRLVAQAELERGCTSIAYDPGLDLLYASCFVSGRLHLIRAEDLAIVTTLSLGPRLWRVSASPSDPRILTAATSAGGFRVDVPRALAMDRVPAGDLGHRPP